ncbi:hypothetical protein [Lunatibacter salilacus]|uniref:hypothetical protein n=1 Tax=Lunatibacter salilacus TaxID=2483804 RepID=UPI00131BE126|nr:hypothetical protein [Lunatibacter salilacus]
MAKTNKDNIQKGKDREKNLSHLRNRGEEIFHLDKELAFSRDEKGKRLLITHLDKGLIVELDVPFDEEFAVEMVKMDKDRDGFTMSGPQGEVWFDLESCWQLAEPLEIPRLSPFPEIMIDQEMPFSIYQEMDELTIECPLSLAGEIQLKVGEMGLLHFGSVFKFQCYPNTENAEIDYIMPVPLKENPNPFKNQSELTTASDFTGEELLMNEIANEVLEEVLDGVFDEDEDELGIQLDRLHFKWTMQGMCFECETDNVSFSFSNQASLWGVEADEFLDTVLIESDSFAKDDIRVMVDYFRTYEGDEIMRTIHQELAGFLNHPDWNSFLKWSYDGTFTTIELRKILENILRHSTEYMEELGLD